MWITGSYMCNLTFTVGGGVQSIPHLIFESKDFSIRREEARQAPLKAGLSVVSGLYVLAEGCCAKAALQWQVFCRHILPSVSGQ